jgi:CheY-like chemotaxis protein
MTAVLLAGHDMGARDVTAYLLKERGYAVLTGKTAKRIVGLLEKAAQPLVVLLDYHLPHGDVLQVLRYVSQRSPELPPCHVVLFGADAGVLQSLVEQQLDPSQISVLLKPLAGDDLFGVVEEAALRLEEGRLPRRFEPPAQGDAGEQAPGP